MSSKEVPRAGLVKAALAGRIINAQGAAALGLTVRQFQRLKVRFRAEGAQGLIHHARGQPSPRRLPAEVRGSARRRAQTLSRRPPPGSWSTTPSPYSLSPPPSRLESVAGVSTAYEKSIGDAKCHWDCRRREHRGLS